MKYYDFVNLVKSRDHFSKTGVDPEASIRSVLEVLGQHLTIGEAEDLAAALPTELKPFIKGRGKAERFGLDEFLARVGSKEGVAPAAAAIHARAVLSAFASLVPKIELIEAFSQLPLDIRDLFMVEEWVKKAA